MSAGAEEDQEEDGFKTIEHYCGYSKNKQSTLDGSDLSDRRRFFKCVVSAFPVAYWWAS